MPIRARSERAAVLPAAAQVCRLPSPFPEHSSSAVYIIVGVASRMRSRSLFAGWKPQGREGNRGPARVGGGQTRRGILSRSITQPTHSKAGSCSCPPAWTPHGLPVLQRHSGQLERRHSGADLVSGTRDAEGISHHLHSPGGPQLIQLMSPSALGLPGAWCQARGQLPPPCILGHPHQLIYATKSFSHLTQANLLLQTNARLQNYFV